MAIITIELLKYCHTAMFFMCFWPFSGALAREARLRSTMGK